MFCPFCAASVCATLKKWKTLIHIVETVSLLGNINMLLHFFQTSVLRWNCPSLNYTELWASIEKQNWRWPWKAHASVSCEADVKTDFGASVFIFTRERGHCTPLSVFVCTDRDRVKGKTGKKRCWLDLIPVQQLRIKPLNHLFQVLWRSYWTIKSHYWCHFIHYLLVFNASLHDII